MTGVQFVIAIWLQKLGHPRLVVNVDKPRIRVPMAKGASVTATVTNS